MKELKINPSFKGFLPSLTVDEYQKLERSILEEGIRDPLVIWDNTIVDGHNRYEIAQKHSLDFQTVNRTFENETAAKLWMGQNQLGKRNLSDAMRIEIALLLEPMIKEIAAKNHQANGGDKKSACQKSDKPIEKVDTKKEVAKLASVSHDTVSKYKKLKEDAPPEILDKVKSGEMKINTAFRTTRTGTKVCSDCGIEKNQNEFPANNATFCRECQNIRRQSQRSEKRTDPPRPKDDFIKALTENNSFYDVNRTIVYDIDDMVEEFGAVISRFIETAKHCLVKHSVLLDKSENTEKIIASLSEAEKAIEEWKGLLL